MKEIELTQGYVAIVDDEDFERISSFSWHVLPSGDNLYGSRTEQKDKKKTNVLMHRLILGITDKSVQVDHKNGNGLDNRKENLRSSTRNQNMRNQTRERSNNTSGYRGVSFEKSSGKWMAYIYPEYENPEKDVRNKLISQCTLDKMSIVDFKAISEFKDGICDAPETEQEIEICKILTNNPSENLP